jgi:hypothetical protein
MIGSIVGAGLKIGGSIYGGIKASQAMKQMKKNIQNQMQENQDWYDRRYNEDATQRADAQAMLTKTEEAIKNRNQQAAGSQAVMGGTEENVAATKEANANAMADAASNITIAGEQRKDNIEQQYMQKKSELNKQLNDLTQQGAKNMAEAVQGAANDAADIAGMF